MEKSVEQLELELRELDDKITYFNKNIGMKYCDPATMKIIVITESTIQSLIGKKMAIEAMINEMTGKTKKEEKKEKPNPICKVNKNYVVDLSKMMAAHIMSSGESNRLVITFLGGITYSIADYTPESIIRIYNRLIDEWVKYKMKG